MISAYVFPGLKAISREDRYSKVLALVCVAFGVSSEDVIGDRKYGNLADARLSFYYLAKHLVGGTLGDIGAFVGGRHHSTVLYGIRRVGDLMDYDKGFNDIIEAITKEYRKNALGLL